MIEKCADYIAFYLVKNGLIEQDKMAIYKYGYEILSKRSISWCLSAQLYSMG